MSKITFQIEYAGLQLTIGKNERGEDVTPLKPIVTEVLGLNWTTQYEKVTKSTFLMRELGVCIPLKGYADDQKREQICIKLDRVAYYLMTINPDRVRANGNISGAEYLEAKISEWADALHDYEEMGVAFNLNHFKMQEFRMKTDRFIAQVIAIKNKTEPKNDRALLEQMILSRAKETGYPYQPDLIDTPAAK